MAKTRSAEQTFESSFKRLEDILNKLENDINETPLDDVMNYYQEGLELLKFCRTKLNETELKIEKIKAGQ
ncbi:MAG: exodeoxyribonuclease VII small subunit [Ignavibacteriae bacterium]|nr:exodeoxyribonuclease VII small subunit [Ignavibacteriota bacterium]MCB0725411.1 exodeoxyribonuclease VII small subunit [Ignavibacteriota bacterium]MCB9243437.1 exodeoxyribonuclease VII small subunit [Ignavibacteriales bacterium]